MVGTILRWVVLIEFVYVFTFPLIYMVTTSVKTLSDLNNPSVHWIPTAPTLKWYGVAMPVIRSRRRRIQQSFDGSACEISCSSPGSLTRKGGARRREACW